MAFEFMTSFVFKAVKFIVNHVYVPYFLSANLSMNN